MIYWPKFIEELRESVRDGLGLGRLLDIGRWPLAVLDDVEATRDPTGFASEKLNLLLGMRVGKWTVLTSNLGLAGLSKIDDRIVHEPGNLFIEMADGRLWDKAERLTHRITALVRHTSPVFRLKHLA